MAFAAVTPFAQEYDAPWLYGVAALSAAGRVAGNQTALGVRYGCGRTVGYVMGSWLWQSQRENRSSVSVNPGPKAVSVAWRGSY